MDKMAKQIIQGEFRKSIGKGEKTILLWELTESEASIHHSVPTYICRLYPGRRYVSIASSV